MRRSESLGRRPRDRLAALPASPWFAYGGLLAVQARALWGLWDKDLTYGDTASYFAVADRWVDDLEVNIAWSPLYTAFYGTVEAFTEGDAVATTAIHRAILVVALAVLVLALLRRLLPAPLALLMACWWAVLPINFDTLYEVHLFAALPLVGAALLLTDDPGPWRRGSALGLLCASTVLVRNEAFLVAAGLAVAILVSEWRARRRGSGTDKRRLMASIAVPLAGAAALVAIAYSRSIVQGDALHEVLETKHRLNVCQVYAANFQQRHPREFPGNPFTECQALMEREFGEPMPSLREAWVSNPGAMTAFTAWNVRLLPNGVQVALFDAASGSANPDYVLQKLGRVYPAILSGLLVALFVAGAVLLRRDWSRWRDTVRAQRWTWFALAGIAGAVVLVVVVTQRPRPSYMFGLSIGVMACAGLALAILIRQRVLEQVAGLAAVAAPLILLIALPVHFKGVTPLRDMYERLKPVSEVVAAPGTAVVPGYGEICDYLAPNIACRALDFPNRIAPLLENKSLKEVLDAKRTDVIYVDSLMATNPEIAQLLSHPRSAGWRIQSSEEDDQGGSWAVLVRL